MTAVFVHGVPETGRLWDRLRVRLETDSRALDLPGFGVPRPAGFGATMDEYVQWLEGELRGIDEPVDLVGHDWGAGLVARVATKSSAVVRSWAVDVAGILHPAYVWHDLAKLWQTPGAGEQWVKTAVEAAAAGSPDDATALYIEAGVPAEDAAALAERFDATMADCILDLYRSATPNPHAHWGAELSAPPSSPGLVIQPLLDPYDDPTASGEMAARLGARTQRLEGMGHWWMLQDPDSAAEALERFWTSVGEG
ncbi:alpha/beta hydrolase [Streptomyces sp. HC44]|uniref:Alpha/beta hydrolase n=1 Tax=Streptomyces scabichelini TaxID=2711217 RepID=A0A6G4V314_9ACTN|nr:alpha/beta hydrolase [Streptomyces scabichelini]NGO08267.1 alpha/beta hydrolase [Streptomyces scabichelini]